MNKTKASPPKKMQILPSAARQLPLGLSRPLSIMPIYLDRRSSLEFLSLIENGCVNLIVDARDVKYFSVGPYSRSLFFSCFDDAGVPLYEISDKEDSLEIIISAVLKAALPGSVVILVNRPETGLNPFFSFKEEKLAAFFDLLQKTHVKFELSSLSHAPP